MARRDITTERIALTFGAKPATIAGLSHLPSSANVCAGGALQLLIRTPKEVSDPVILSEVAHRGRGDDSSFLRFQDESGKYRADLRIDPSDSGLRFQAAVHAPEPIWLVEWKITGLDLENVIIPALGGQVLTRDMPAGTTLSYKYPFWWNAQFVIGELKTGGGILLRSQDPEPDLKLLRVSRENNGFGLTYGFEAPAPLNSRTLDAEWYLDAYEGDWRAAADEHRAWMEQAFNLTALEDKAHSPGWGREVNFVLELWGARKDSAMPPHTFEQMIERLHQWKDLHDPHRTLVYLPGFAEHGIDSHAPDYRPSEMLGGEEKFRLLVDTAHELGYRVMVHTNVLAMTYSHRLYPRFKDHQVVDAFGRPQGWGLDLDGDWLPEPYFAYINPGTKAWGDLMEGVIGGLIADLRVDAVFLDQTLLAFNVSRGPNFLVGMRDHIRRLQTAFPQVLFAGEGMHEHVLGSLPMAQIHGIDSIAEVHGMDGGAPWRMAHPVSTYLFGRHTRFTAHLLTKHPSHPLFEVQESAYRELGVIPALCLYRHDQAMDLPEVRAMIARADELMGQIAD